MKPTKKIFGLITLLLFVVLSISVAQEKSELISSEFKVSGNCGMCEKRIVKALMVDGVQSATWDKESKLAKVTYNKEMISEDQLQENVAAVGHDTEKFKASDEVYSKLPKCCKFERTTETKNDEMKKQDSKGMDAHGSTGGNNQSCCK